MTRKAVCLLRNGRPASAEEMSDVVVHLGVGQGREDPRYGLYKRDRDAEERLLDLPRPGDPLQILIVTAKLLTGFDAPILQAMYLDKPLRDHALAGHLPHQPHLWRQEDVRADRRLPGRLRRRRPNRWSLTKRASGRSSPTSEIEDALPPAMQACWLISWASTAR